MANPGKNKTRLPGRQEILDFLADCPGPAGRREIARAFGLGSRERGALGRLLREMKEDGLLGGNQPGEKGAAPRLPPVTVVQVIGADENGDVLVRPQVWREDRPPPPIYLLADRRGGPAPGAGELVLARLTAREDGSYHAAIMRRIAARPSSFLAVLDKDGRLHETEKRRAGRFYSAAPGGIRDARPGDLVRAELEPGRRHGARQARIVERLGPGEGPDAYCAMAIARHGLPDIFGEEALAQAAAAGPAGLAERVDLRHLALVTIDDEDARDFDDAVWAEPDEAAEKAGGWHIVVAIADVAWYVRPGDALDASAQDRGNSVYLPGRVLPMLPEALSNHWCSLKPGEDRPCFVVHLWIDGEGRARGHRFERALMRSAARLTYKQVQEARDGGPVGEAAALLETVVGPLYGAHEALMAEAGRRQPLAIEVAERKALLDGDGRVQGLEKRPLYESHRLIEAFMIAANVAAARSLEEMDLPCMYRLHDSPPLDKLEAFRQFLAGTGLQFPRSGQVMPRHFNRILEKAQARGEGELINDIVLRTQSVASYGPQRLGHFGLALASYAHFTSPIRRYADLLVHRALIAGLGAGAGGRAAGVDELKEIGAKISDTERRAVVAEREVLDRLAVSLLSDRIGASFPGRVSGVTRAGLFVALDEVGADGLLPMSRLPGGRYTFDARKRLLRAGRAGRQFRLGDRLEVRIAEISPPSGSMILELSGTDSPGGPRGLRKR